MREEGEIRRNHQANNPTNGRTSRVVSEGYANEVGEAFRSITSKSVVWSSYFIACGYVLADTVSKGIQAYKVDSSKTKTKSLFFSTLDTLLWQSFASVVIPGITINRLCATIIYFQKRATVSAFRSPWISTVVGLSSIPVIVHPIDILVEQVMNKTYRQWTGYRPPKSLHSPVDKNNDNS